MFALAVDGDDAPKAFQQPFARFILSPQHGTGRLHAILPSLPGLPTQLLFHTQRPDQGAGGGGAENPQADLGAARDGLVKHLQRVVDRRQGDDRGGIAGQHKGVGPGTAQLRRRGRAQRQPQREGDQEQAWCLGEQADKNYRHERADQGAGQARQALLHHHTGQRLSHDERRHQCP